ncbi:MAG: hypothetical protein JXO72_13065 [Vicinamibacteria bacterium]|nr:hypothetical protein [Vicinamibacteria bacterium]
MRWILAIVPFAMPLSFACEHDLERLETEATHGDSIERGVTAETRLDF